MLIGGALQYFERIIVHFLILMMAVVILLATGQLGWLIVQDVVTPPLLVLEIGELLDIFGFFLLILIGIELLKTIEILQDDELSRLLTFPHVLITAHQAFLTHEALSEIARVTTGNFVRLAEGQPFLEESVFVDLPTPAHASAEQTQQLLSRRGASL